MPAIVLLGSCQPEEAARQEINEVGISEINQLLQGAVESGEIPGVVAIVANRDRILYHQSFGQMDLQNDLDMRKESIFSIASMTKPITSVAVMQLVEEGRLRLRDPLADVLPEFADPQVFVGGTVDAPELVSGGEALGQGAQVVDVELLEASTPELDDVVRLEDRYGRTGD